MDQQTFTVKRQSSDPFYQGSNAYLDGCDSSNCVYADGTVERGEWLYGWYSAMGRDNVLRTGEV